MKKIAFIAIMSLAAACSSSRHSTLPAPSPTAPSGRSSGDGSSYATAIVIREKSETSGVAAEYQWIRVHYPGSKNGGQALVYNNKIPYDVLTITTEDGTKKDVYFDISNFFGKY